MSRFTVNCCGVIRLVVQIVRLGNVVTPMLIVLACFVSSASGETVTWTGAYSDSLASSEENWAEGRLPQNGDEVLFNGTSSNDCMWDIDPVLESLSIEAGYDGTVYLQGGLTISGDIRIEAGVLNADSNEITVGGNWIYFDGMDMVMGDVALPAGELTGADTDLILNMAIGNEDVRYCSDINYDSSTDILDVVLLIRKLKGMDNQSQQCTGGRFIPGNGTVRLNGTNQVIYGNAVFFNLEKTASCPGDTLYFEANTLQVILGSLSLTGEDGCLLGLASDTPGGQWDIDPRGTRNISFSGISGMNNINIVDIVTSNSEDNGGNGPGVKFGGNLCACNDKDLQMAYLSNAERRHP